MKKYLYIAMLGLAVCLGLGSCSEDAPSDPTNFPTTPVERNAFDQWLLKNFTYPYNVSFLYKMKDIESDMTKNLVPADSAKSTKLAIIIKYLWFDAYAEAIGPDFIKENVPRVIHLIGSPAFNSNGTIVLGTAEGGQKVTLYTVNSLTDKNLKDYSYLNDYYFHTMHHEFTHILNQKIAYNKSFDKVTASGYVSGDWTNVEDVDAQKKGFVTAYAMEEGKEDFAEMLSTYVTSTPTQWEKILSTAGANMVDETLTARQAIEQKLSIVRDYMSKSWGLDIDKLRDAVLHRGNELSSLDLEHLN
uniref:zinc-binding metallopeptidase n=1 Tax=Prevotella sp. TaxID=59823 RepID=UPI00402805B1